MRISDWSSDVCSSDLDGLWRIDTDIIERTCGNGAGLGRDCGEIAHGDIQMGLSRAFARSPLPTPLSPGRLGLRARGRAHTSAPDLGGAGDRTVRPVCETMRVLAAAAHLPCWILRSGAAALMRKRPRTGKEW